MSVQKNQLHHKVTFWATKRACVFSLNSLPIPISGGNTDRFSI